MPVIDEKLENSVYLPTIALIVDVENWAFHNYAKQISQRLSDSYSFQIFFYGQYKEIEDLMLEVKDFDLIHFFWRGALRSFLGSGFQESLAKKNLDYNDFIGNVIAKANITTSVYDHLYLSKEEIQQQAILYSALSIGYTTCSEKLNSIYSSIPDYPAPDYVIENGVDLKLFAPSNPERFYKEKDEIVIGWSGNSKWGDDGIDHKGLETIIKPAIKSLREEGYNVRGFFADRQERWIPHSEMNDYYNSIDVYVCASDMEGSPDPVLESMACGLPVISTDVGIVPELFGLAQRNYILPTRNVEELKEKLKELIKDPQKREAISKENLESIKKRSWERQSLKWDTFFNSMLSNTQQAYFKERKNYLRKQVLKTYLSLNSSRELTRNLENNVEELQTALGNSDNRVSKLEKWTLELQTSLHNSQSRITELEKWTFELQTALDNSGNRVSELEKWTVELQTVLRNSEKRISELEKWTLELQTSLHNSENRVSELDQLAVELQTSLAEANDQIKIAQLKVDELQLALEQSQDERREMEADLFNLNEIITAMEESKFWKLRNQWFKLKDSLPATRKDR